MCVIATVNGSSVSCSFAISCSCYGSSSVVTHNHNFQCVYNRSVIMILKSFQGKGQCYTCQFFIFIIVDNTFSKVLALL